MTYRNRLILTICEFVLVTRGAVLSIDQGQAYDDASDGGIAVGGGQPTRGDVCAGIVLRSGADGGCRGVRGGEARRSGHARFVPARG